MKIQFCDYWLIPIENVYEIDEEFIDCNFDCEECHYCSYSKLNKQVYEEEK